jgi:hypothetical protein
MKKLLVLFLLFIPLFANAQTDQGVYYIYNIISFEGNFNKEGVKVQVDNGKEVYKLRDEKGKRIIFKTPAGALMYFLSQGWIMYLSGATSEGSFWAGSGGSETSSYWIMRKPCTKQEFEDAVKEARKD